jgi:hypothetical protein
MQLSLWLSHESCKAGEGSKHRSISMPEIDAEQG